MKMRSVLVLCLACLATVSQAGQKPFSVRISADKDESSMEVPDEGIGRGTAKRVRVTFRAKLENRRTRSVGNISLKLFVYGAHHTWADGVRDHMERRLLSRGPFTLAGHSRKTLKLGTVDFESAEGSTRKGDWRSGYKCAGYALEVYVDGKLVDTKFKGSDVRKAHKSD